MAIPMHRLNHLQHNAQTTKQAPPPLNKEEAQRAIISSLHSHNIADSTEINFRLNLSVGDSVDIRHDNGNWYVAFIQRQTFTHIFVAPYEKHVPAMSMGLYKGGIRIAQPFTRSQSAQTAAPPPLSPLSAHDINKVDIVIHDGDTILHAPIPPAIDLRKGRIIHKPMPKDNSCLFHAIAYVCNRKTKRSGLSAITQRLRAHSLVKSDPQTFTSDILGAPVDKYLESLLQPHSWGSAIELTVYSHLYQTEIYAFDYSQPTVYRFGEGRAYKKRVMLAYSGNHYDCLVWTFHDREDEQEYFHSADRLVLVEAKTLIEKLYLQHAKKPQKAPVGHIQWIGPGVYELGEIGSQLYRQLMTPRGQHLKHTISLDFDARNRSRQTSQSNDFLSATSTTPRSLPSVPPPLPPLPATNGVRVLPPPLHRQSSNSGSRTRRTSSSTADILPLDILQAISPALSPETATPFTSSPRLQQTVPLHRTLSSNRKSSFTQSPSPASAPVNPVTMNTHTPSPHFKQNQRSPLPPTIPEANEDSGENNTAQNNTRIQPKRPPPPLPPPLPPRLSISQPVTTDSSSTQLVTPRTLSRQGSLKPGEYWTCQRCTLRNPLNRSTCKLCNTARLVINTKLN